MLRTNDNELERLPIHQAVLVGIENSLKALESLNDRKPKIQPSTDVGSLHQDFRKLFLHEKEEAKAKGELSAYLSLVWCNMKVEHLDEIKKKLWELTQRFDNSDIVSTLRKLNNPNPVAKKPAE